MLSPLCNRAGCPHQHHDGPRRHGWCCNACRLGEEFHTDNCSGRGERVVDVPPAQPVCARVGCSFAHLNGQRHHGYCCSACKRGDPVHTRNCTGYKQAVTQLQSAHAHVPDATMLAPTQNSAVITDVTSRLHGLEAIYLPSTWRLGEDDDMLTHLEWYARRFGLDMEAGAMEAWKMLEDQPRRQRKTRPLRLYAFAQDSTPPGVAMINVHDRGLNARCNHLYRMQEVTGLDFRVQAVLITQQETACVLLDACRLIEVHGLNDFCFVCQGGTHRSVGCCVLLAALIYQNTEVILTTSRTRNAAVELGMASRFASFSTLGFDWVG